MQICCRRTKKSTGARANASSRTLCAGSRLKKDTLSPGASNRTRNQCTADILPGVQEADDVSEILAYSNILGLTIPEHRFWRTRRRRC